MEFTKADCTLTEQLHLFKEFGVKKGCQRISAERLASVRRLLKMLKKTGTTNRRLGSTRPRTSKIKESINQYSFVKSYQTQLKQLKH